MSLESSDFNEQPASYDAHFDDDGRAPLAIAAGLIAALMAGGIWAVLVLGTDTEIGYAAWGIGVAHGRGGSPSVPRVSP